VVLARSGSLEGMMKRLAMAVFVLLAATSARTEAGSLPKAKSPNDQEKPTHQTHFVRGAGARLPQPLRDASRKSHRDLHQTHFVRGK
jgi:hypothetical protein